VVPAYIGWQPDHILNVIWKGRAVTYTELNPISGLRVLKVPRVEFVDSIGMSTIEVSYSVQVSAASNALVSELLEPVRIDEQVFILSAPSYNPTTRVMTVSDTSAMSGYKIRIRWGGVVAHDGLETLLDTSRLIPIPLINSG
jgi:hypothetical protein